MAVSAVVVRSVKTIGRLPRLLFNMSLSSTHINSIPLLCSSRRTCLMDLKVDIHTSAKRNSLMEFFDDEKNWCANRVKVGRSWKLDELRLRSNEDLHKLWYILLKEKNMLLTMEHACKEKYEYFPNPERVDKIEESMENVETVVRERNRAYHELETGEHGERPTRIAHNQIGLPFRHKMTEHIIPKFMNNEWRKNNIHHYGGFAVSKFLRKYREKLLLQNRRIRNCELNQVQKLLRRYPNMDMDALKSKYPNVDIEKVKTSKRAQGHFIPG